MPRTDDGEFELVLGNKQLLSVFFIMVVLLGVFFAMGYIAGRNSAPGTSDVAKKADTGKAIVVDNPQRTSPMPPDNGAQTSQPAQPASDTSTSTQPVASSQPPPQQEQPPAKPPQAEAPAPAPKPAPPKETEGTPQVAEPEPGVAYLQVVATTRPEAEVIAGTLSRRGYKTQLAPVPNAPTFRVLVGPLKNASDIARTRADLEKAGFKPIIRRF